MFFSRKSARHAAHAARPARPTRPPQAAASAKDAPARDDRRTRLLRALVVLILLALLGGLGCWGLRAYTEYTRSHYQIRYYRLTSAHVSERLRIVFLSDLHLREYGEGNAELVENIRALDPDLILLGGDLVTFPNPNYDKMLTLCQKLAALAPVYGVLGNHESEILYGGVDPDLAEKFTAAGVHLLRNEQATLQLGSNTVELVGLEGALDDFDKYGASDRAESLTSQYDAFRICLDHVPMAFVDHLEDTPFDLGLAGHTHGGLIRLPVLGRLYSAEEGLFPTYAGGSYTLSSGATLIVGCGLGDSNNIPRIYNPPELVLVDVNWY